MFLFVYFYLAVAELLNYYKTIAVIELLHLLLFFFFSFLFFEPYLSLRDAVQP